MIILNNNGKSIVIKNSANCEYQILTLAKGITLKPREKFSISTGITIECTDSSDECWVYSDPIFDKKGEEVSCSDNIGIITHRITKENGVYELNLIGGYMGDEEVKLPKGAEIANVYFSASNPFQKELGLDCNTLYSDDNIIVKTAKEFYGTYELVSNPEQGNYIRIHLPS